MCIRDSLYSENRPQGWLTKHYGGFFTEKVQPLGQAYRSRSLTLTGRGWSDCSHKDKLCMGRFLFINQRERQLGLVFSVKLQVIFFEPKLASHFDYRLYYGTLSNLNICFHQVFFEIKIRHIYFFTISTCNQAASPSAFSTPVGCLLYT